MKKLLFLLTIISFMSVNILGQAIPKQIDYQGVLKTAAGGIVPDGNYPMSFKIYNDPTGGAALWTETQTVAVANGLFSAHLGSSTPIVGVPFDRIQFLGITLGTEPELLPRTMLTPSPYSFMSMNVLDNTITTNKLQDGAVTGVKIGNNEVVKSLNGIKDNVTLVAGTNITLTPSGNNLTINAGGGGGGTVTQINTGAGLTGGPIMTSGMISVPNDGISDVMLQNNSVTSSKITDGSINAVDIGNSQVLKSLNTLKDNVTLVAGSNISITPSGQNLTIASTSSGVGGGGSANYIPLFTAGTTLGNSKLSQDASGNIALGINGTAGELRLSAMDNTNEGGQILWIGAGGNDGWLQDSYINSMRLFTTSSNNNKLEIFNNGTGKAGLYVEGNVGIGISSPSFPLVVESNTASRVISGEYTGTTTTDGIAVYGKSTPSDNYGIGGSFLGGYMGVRAEISTGGISGTYYGVYSLVNGTMGYKYGVRGSASGTGTTNYGIYGYSGGATTNWAGYFSGNVNVTGTLSKGGGSFKIDHPLDPANKYLYHSFVESPDMMNIYNGNVTTDGSGYATIKLPDWFEALNKDFRYQLTVIGDFAQAIVSQKVQNNQFTVRTDKPGIEVSWQVTGIRKDAFAEKNRIPVEELKQGNEIGKYLYPDALGMPENLGVDYESNQTPEQRK